METMSKTHAVTTYRAAELVSWRWWLLWCFISFHIHAFLLS